MLAVAGSCAPLEERQTAIENLRNDVRRNIVVVSVSECGGGLWYPVASLDMTDVTISGSLVEGMVHPGSSATIMSAESWHSKGGAEAA